MPSLDEVHVSFEGTSNIVNALVSLVHPYMMISMSMRIILMILSMY